MPEKNRGADWGEFDYEYEYENSLHRRSVKILEAFALLAALTAYACDFHNIRSAYPINYESLFHSIHTISIE